MKKLFTTISLTLLLTVPSLAQAPDTLWTKTYGGIDGDYATHVQQTSDSGFVIVGSTYSFGVGEWDVWLIKTDEHGDTVWTRTFGGSGSEAGNCVKQTSDGGYIIFGITSSFGAGQNDIWLIKTDIDGLEEWNKSFGGEYEDIGNFGEQTSDNGYIIVGWTSSFSNDGKDVWLIKTDENGDSLWSKSYDIGFDDYGNSVIQTSDSGYVLTGSSDNGKLLLIKTNKNGDEEWNKTFADTNITYSGNSLYQVYDGGYIITGNAYDLSLSNRDVLLLKTDSTGNKLWSRTFGTVGADRGFSVQQTFDLGFFITGSTAISGQGQSDVWVIKTDSNGKEEWNKVIGRPYQDTWESGKYGQQTFNGGFIIVGARDSFTPSIMRDIWFIRLDSDLVGIEEEMISEVPTNYFLYQNYPNPFNPSTTISWQVPVGGWLTIKIYDVLGNEVATLVDGYKSAGTYEVEWNAAGLPSGIYFYQLKTDGFFETRKMILVK